MDDKRNRKRVTALIHQVRQNPCDALMKANPVVQELAQHGAIAVGPVLRAMQGPVPPGQHARDMVEALGAVLNAIARVDPAPLIRVLERDDAPADPQLLMLVSALGFGRTAKVVEPLIGALRHPSPYVRWSAAIALVGLRTKRALIPLTAALRDRSPMVYGTVVHAMHDNKFYRNAAAIGPLQMIVRRPRIKKELPGLWREAQALLTRLEVSSSDS